MDTITTEPLDFCFDQGLRSTLIALENRYDVQMLVVNHRGPGGGWPEVTITGAPENVERCIRESWTSGDDEQDEELVRLVMRK
jgi:hypothetical protein